MTGLILRILIGLWRLPRRPHPTHQQLTSLNLLDDPEYRAKLLEIAKDPFAEAG